MYANVYIATQPLDADPPVCSGGEVLPNGVEVF